MGLCSSYTTPAWMSFRTSTPMCLRPVLSRAMARSTQQESNDDIDLSESFLWAKFSHQVSMMEKVKQIEVYLMLVRYLCPGKLISDQSEDKTLAHLFLDALSDEKSGSIASGYFLRDGLLMRKWTLINVFPVEEWSVVTQIVVSTSYRTVIWKLAHDNPLQVILV